ncbi:MAG: hypothetical protein QMD14_03960 [Candidatus Aenigmarchaeota archaeon]|nr:hypothetical protein [Candidatus Aenigmarchaeota archaeon]
MVLRLNENEMLHELIKLNGVIWKKAELSRDFRKFYSEVFEKISSLKEVDEMILEVLGDVGG